MQRIFKSLSSSAIITLLAFQTVSADQSATYATSAVEVAAISGLKMPESAVSHPDGRVFISEIGEFGVDGDGKITVVNTDGSTEALATGLNDPKGVGLFEDHLYVADNDRLLRINLNGDVEVLASAEDFPGKPEFLNDIVIDGAGHVYISDSGDDDGNHAGIYRYSKEGEITEILDQTSDIKRPNGLLLDGINQLLVADFGTGKLYRFDMATAHLEAVNQGFGGADGLVRDANGFLYVSDWANGKVWQLVEPKSTPQLIADHFESAADIGISADGRFLLVPDMMAGRLEFLPIR